MEKHTVFNITQYSFNYLMTSIDDDVIVLPDLYCPFIGDNLKVRNLFNSLYVGLPVGMFMLWKINDSNDEIQYINGLDKILRLLN